MRDSLKPGDLVKLLFVVGPPVQGVEVERMWVEVLEGADGGYVGRLDNKPGSARNLKAGDRVSFRPEHVAARDAPEGDPLYLDPDTLVIVSRRVWEDDAWPRRLERHDVPDPQFSGWIVFAGDEPPSYVADIENFAPVGQAELFDRFRVLDSGLEGPVGTTMAWDDAALEFVAAAAARPV